MSKLIVSLRTFRVALLSSLFFVTLFAASCGGTSDQVASPVDTDTPTAGKISRCPTEQGYDDQAHYLEYHFEGGNHVVRDSSNRNNEGLFREGASRRLDENSLHGHYLRLDGIDDHVAVHDVANLRSFYNGGSFTVAANVYPTDTTGWRPILSKGAYFRVGLDEGIPAVFLAGVGELTCPDLLFLTDEWAHFEVAFNLSLGALLARKNGGPYTQCSAVETPPDPPTDDPVTIGSAEGFGYYAGYMDDLEWLTGASSSRLNIDPEGDCPAGFLCNHDVIVRTPSGLGRPVPIRIRTLFRDGHCVDAPCRLVVTLMGGGRCSQGFHSNDRVAELAGRTDQPDGVRYIVASVFPSCYFQDAEEPRLNQPDQVIQAVNFLKHDLSSLVAGHVDATLPYYLIGGSNGAYLASAIHSRADDADAPRKTFAASALFDLDAVYHLSPDIVPRHIQQFDRYFGFCGPHPTDESTHMAIGRTGAVDVDDPTDLARWHDVATKRPIVFTSGNRECPQGTAFELVAGFVWSAEQYRNLWEASSSPHNYRYMQLDDEGACQHVAGYDSTFDTGSWKCVGHFFALDGDTSDMPGDWRDCL